jgi:3-hydroxy-9,10-secoandrosta-1,3,5(10)-triene-9,17-dione monooxygenase reductase component
MTNTATIDSKQFRKALGSFTTGVTVVTTRGVEGEDVGLTANSFNSVSLDPPMVLWSLDRKSSSAAAFLAAEHFAVHILASDQEHVSNQFAKRGIDRFAGLAVERGHGDVPLLAGCSARFECRALYRHDGGDHVIFVGEVVAFDSFGRAPLVFHAGNYGLLMKKKAEDGEGASSSFGDVELMAAGKSAETDAAGDLDSNEVLLLKLLLKRVIRATGNGLPEHWRKENIWRENNVWGAIGATGGSST